jgi:site-specific recombinase XerD
MEKCPDRPEYKCGLTDGARTAKRHITIKNPSRRQSDSKQLAGTIKINMSQNSYSVILFRHFKLEGIMECLSEKQLLAVLKEAKKESIRDHCLILVTYKHGLRASETADLKLGDIQDGCLSVERKKGSLHTNQAITPHKGEPLLDEVKAIRAWLKVRPDDGSDALFNSQMGDKMSREHITRIFKKHALAAGIPAELCHIHVLKHSCGTHLINRNTDVAMVKQVLGHRNIQNTMIYAKPSDKVAMKAAQRAWMEAFR